MDSLIFAEISCMKRLLVIGYVWPEPGSSAAGSRMMFLLNSFKNRDYKICFATTASRTAYMADLESLGITTKSIRLNDSSFDRFLSDFKPDVVLFDRFMMEEQFGWRVDDFAPKAIKVLDTEDLHFLRKAREEAWKKKLPETSLILDSDLTKREIASIYRCDLSLIISDFEMDLLKNQFNIPFSILFYFPFLVPEIKETEDLPKFKERGHFLTIGNFKHEPNRNSVLYLKEMIWPLIRKELPKAELHIYGAYESAKIKALHHPASGFQIKGRAADSREVMKNARICIAPLRFGAGIKGKFIEAMQCGTPSVTTPVGTEGIASSREWPGMVKTEPEAIAKAAVDLYLNEKNWQMAHKKGVEIINERFTDKGISGNFFEILESVKAKLQSHRRENFTGAMLKHHQHRSTYFMAKFIEEKNRDK
ncbi:glycosyltransferase [Salegentibacter chungangensis]|uniref:Glycosyltransferase n=1 Tax=Salegentibacter chungangensis TaxID=1335724 RepID=A0ABW3NSA3_9FLAO